MEKTPFLQECLSKGLINVYSLASYIKKDVESELKKEVKTTAIMMALRRLAESLENKTEFKMKKYSFDILIKSNLFEFTIKNKNNELYNKIINFVDVNNEKFLNITRGLSETTIITHEKYIPDITKMLKLDDVIIDNLSAIIIKLPKDNQNIPGLYYLFIRELAWYNITIVELVSTLNEMIIIVDDSDIPQAYKVIKTLIKEKD